MDLFIANLGRSVAQIEFRPTLPDLGGRPAEPSQERPRQVRVPPGGAARIWTDIPEVIARIVADLVPYGLRPISEIMQGDKFTGLAYSTDGAIDMNVIQAAHAAEYPYWAPEFANRVFLAHSVDFGPALGYP